MKNTNFSNACREISQSLLQITEPTKNHAKTEIKRICTKYSLDKIPKNYEILSTVDGKSYRFVWLCQNLDMLFLYIYFPLIDY